MPLPEPDKENETEDEFIDRCMSDDKMVGEYGQDQRFSICQSQWDEAQESLEKEFLDGKAFFDEFIGVDKPKGQDD